MPGTVVRSIIFGLVGGLCLAGATRAEDPEQSFATLIGRGFKVVATTYAPPNDTIKAPTVIVTLQLDKAIAVCTYGYGTWENMSAQLKDDAKACDVRFY